MKKRAIRKKAEAEDTMRKEYDFSDGVRGKHAKRPQSSVVVVELDPDVAEIFPDRDSANAALRALAEIVRGVRKTRKRESEKD